MIRLHPPRLKFRDSSVHPLQTHFVGSLLTLTTLDTVCHVRGYFQRIGRGETREGKLVMVQPVCFVYMSYYFNFLFAFFTEHIVH